jgi:heme/copper-type cytochrome/quinol oxidase subunit 2
MPSEGEQVTFLYDVFLVVAAGIFVVAAALVGWSILHSRATGDARLGGAHSQNVRLELLWWALPTALVIILFILTAQVLGASSVAPSAAAA